MARAVRQQVLCDVGFPPEDLTADVAREELGAGLGLPLCRSRKLAIGRLWRGGVVRLIVRWSLIVVHQRIDVEQVVSSIIDESLEIRCQMFGRLLFDMIVVFGRRW